MTPYIRTFFFPETENLNFGHRWPSCPYKPLSKYSNFKISSISKQFSVTRIQIFSFKEEKCSVVCSYNKNISKYFLTKMYLYHILVIWTLCTCFKRVLLPASWAPRIKMSISSGSFLSSCRICLSIFLLIALASSTLPKTRLYKCEKIQPMMLFLTTSRRGPRNFYVVVLNKGQ